MALELRTGHIFVERSSILGYQCSMCCVWAPSAKGAHFWGVDGWFGESADLPDCETVQAGAEESDAPSVGEEQLDGAP